MPARQGGVDGTPKRFPACRALKLRQLAEFSQRPLDRPNMARSREKVLHGVVDFRHAWVIAPASEKGRASKQRDGGGELRLLAAEISGCSDQRRWVCALRGGTLDSDVEEPGILPSRKPFTLVAAGFDQIQEHPAVVPVRVCANQRAVDR